MTVALYANTPYQLMNCISYVYNNVEDSYGNSDLYIMFNEKYADDIKIKLSNTNLFNHIYTIPVCSKLSHGATYYFKSLIYILYPKILFTKVLGDSFHLDYTCIMTSHPAPVVASLARLSKKAYIYYYDDGIGSYYGELIRSYKSNILRYFMKIINLNIDLFVPRRIYINSEKFCCSKYTNINKMPAIISCIPILDEVFSYKPSYNYASKIIFLTTIMTKNGRREYEQIEFDIFKFLMRKCSGSFLIRKHPRDMHVYKREHVDLVNNLWELEAYHSIGSESVLISYFSTAQFTPKILFNKEPALFFLYGLFRDYIGSEMASIYDQLVGKLVDVYNDKQKVIIIENIEQLRLILEKLRKAFAQ
jgi:hypothetical protein